MNIVDRIFGRRLDLETPPPPTGTTRADAEAVAQYERMLASSSAKTIERVHVEAFERLSPQQLDLLFERFTAEAPTAADSPADARPKSLAKAAARSEKRRPGTIRRVLGGAGDPVVDTIVGYTMLDTIADIAWTSALWASWDGGVGDGWFGGDRW
ncbi:hypothetical protein P5G50_06565 [Leifsonia sp. F6_8S_P_1B]|uniref:Uncharacterized protein n=1 Tax=Leifsonia williamsii TaxID=3035919 RepID=A0ABT8KAS6_9MICO|nr:hypothetical protein [Leifsonia williamsii]MDN4614113.1 hypothetical protein [Leifsonia williamsii]